MNYKASICGIYLILGCEYVEENVNNAESDVCGWVLAVISGSFSCSCFS